MSVSTQRDSIIARFMKESHCIIVDQHQSSRVRLASILQELGASTRSISLASSYEEAQAAIKLGRPKLVICDYYIGRKAGLDLLQEQRKENPGCKDSLFILVSSNTSQAAVARAAEEDVDAFIIKPYSLETLRSSLLAALDAKLAPSEYVRTIEVGKDKLFSGEANAALNLFDRAMELDPKPALACFYRGLAKTMKKELEAATDTYEEGLEYNRIHYKCLVGLFDVLMKEKRHADAYRVVRRVVQYFPANPWRLGSVLRLAIVTGNYQDIEGYYQIFTNLEERTDELVRYACSALLVTGKYYLSINAHTRAISLFEKALISGPGRTAYIRYAVEHLVKAKLLEPAKTFMARFPAQTHKGEDYLVCDYLLKSRMKSPKATIQQGRELLKARIKSPIMYKLLIEGYVLAGLENPAEGLVDLAANLWPEEREEFKNVFLGAKKAAALEAEAAPNG